MTTGNHTSHASIRRVRRKQYRALFLFPSASGEKGQNRSSGVQERVGGKKKKTFGSRPQRVDLKGKRIRQDSKPTHGRARPMCVRSPGAIASGCPGGREERIQQWRRVDAVPAPRRRKGEYGRMQRMPLLRVCNYGRKMFPPNLWPLGENLGKLDEVLTERILPQSWRATIGKDSTPSLDKHRPLT